MEAALVMPVIFGTLFLLYSLAIVQYKNITARCAAMRVANRAAMNWNTIGGNGNNILVEDKKKSIYMEDLITEKEFPQLFDEEGKLVVKSPADAFKFAGQAFDALVPVKKPEDMKTGERVSYVASLKEHDPYRFFVGLFTTGVTKKNNLNAYMEYQLGKTSGVDGVVSSTSSSSVGQQSSFLVFNRYVTVTVDSMHESPLFGFLEGMGFHVEKSSKVTAKAKLTDPEEFIRDITFFEELWRKKSKKNN